MRPQPLLLALALTLDMTPALGAQWHSGRDLPLITRAVELRIGRDTAQRLGGWQATAHGVVSFALVIDHDGTPIERVVRADELRLEVYGDAPNRSKQVIVAWRDTTFFPTTVVYHRDHLGIVARDFGPTIRIGEGDEVRDVPHPLSPSGLDFYEFRPGLTIGMAGLGGEVRVTAVDVRPREEGSAGAVGTLYLDADRGMLVRFRFSFTGSAYRDPTVDRISVSLENAMIDGTAWLPWRQSVVIRRADPVLGLPIGSVLRADWEISNYRLGERLPATIFTGAQLAGPTRPGVGDWSEPFALSLSDSAESRTSLDALQGDARRLVGRRSMSGLPRLNWLGSDGLSGVIRADRVEGIRFGAGADVRVTGEGSLHLAAGWGSSDHRLTGRMHFAWPLGGTAWRFRLDREVIDIADRPRVSRLVNTFQTIVASGDLGDWRLRDRIGLGADWSFGALEFEMALDLERHSSVVTRFRGLGRGVEPNPPLGYGEVAVASLGLQPRNTPDWHIALERGEGDADWSRVELRGEFGLPLGFGGRIQAGAATTGAPVARSFVVGGRGSLPGVADRSVGGRRLVLLRLERPLAIGWSVPGPASWGGRLTLVRGVTPFIATARAGGGISEAPWHVSDRWHTVLGLSVTLGDPILRVEWGWDPATGGMLVTIDADRLWWPIL